VVSSTRCSAAVSQVVGELPVLRGDFAMVVSIFPDEGDASDSRVGVGAPHGRPPMRPGQNAEVAPPLENRCRIPAGCKRPADFSPV